MATGTLTPTPYQTVLDANGKPVSGAKITTYVAGTTTPTSTYTDVALSVANTNPILTDSAGRYVAFLSPGASYKFAITDSANVAIRTVDNISAVPAASVNLDVTGTAGEALTAGQAVYLSDGSGSKTAGQWFKTDATNPYSSTTNVVGMVPAAITSGQSGTIRLAGQVPGLSALTIGTTYYLSGSTPGAITATPPTNRRVMGEADTTSSLVLQPWPLVTPPVNNGVAQGRLTLTTGTPVTTSDVTGASTIYYTPYTGNLIALYDGSATWNVLTFAELSVALSGLIVGQGYDVFAYNNAGVVALETLEWANATVTMTIAAPGVVTWTAHGMSTGWSIAFTTTGALPTGVTANTLYWITVVDANTFKLSTSPANVAAGTFVTTSGTQSGTHTGHQGRARQTAVTLQNGVYVKSGATTRRYLGSFLASAATTTEDSVTKRYVWNYANRIRRALLKTEATANWAYTLATWRQANGATANQLDLFVGLAEALLDLRLSVFFNNSTVNILVGYGIGVDSTNTPITTVLGGHGYTPPTTNTAIEGVALLTTYPAIGWHSYVWLEYSTATGTTTWYGAGGIGGAQDSGLVGWIEG